MLKSHGMPATCHPSCIMAAPMRVLYPSMSLPPSPPLCPTANGRAAMLGFTGLALTEFSKHTPALEQIANSIPAIILVSLTFTVATVLPKLVSGSSLKELHAAASSENLKAEGALGQLLALFDQNLELWSGRLAMVGISGLCVVEAIKGDALF